MNPFQLLNMMKTAANPMAAIQQMAQNNPQMQQILSNIQGKNPQELEQYARNIAQSKGVNLQQYMSQFGINIQ